MFMLHYIKFDLFLKNSLAGENLWGNQERTLSSPQSPENSHIPENVRAEYEALKRRFEEAKWGEKYNAQYEKTLREWLLREGDPQDKEYREIALKVKQLQERVNTYRDQQQDLQRQLSQLLWQVQAEIKTLSPKENKIFSTIDSRGFLEIPLEKRLQYITKPSIDMPDVASGSVKDLTFSFTYDGKFNRELYMKTTAGQVLPREVGSVVVWWKQYSRTNVWWEFFAPGNERLTIHEWTQIEIDTLRTSQDLENLSKENQIKIDQYVKEHPNDNKEIVGEAIARWIDPKFANIAFGDLVKGLSDNQATIALEDAFTEFDRYRGNFNLWNELQDGKYSETLVMGLFTQFSKDWKQSAKDYWISPERIKAAETNGEVYYWMDAMAIQNADSMPDGTYLKWEQLLQNPQFSAKIDKVCASLWANREDLIKVMKAESRLDPRIVNKQSWATWLIQFMPRTAAWLGTSVGNIRAMTWVEQLDLIEKYFKQNSRGHNLSTIEDLYKVVFFPLSLWKSNDWVFDAKDAPAHKVASQNPWISKFSQRWDGLIDGYAFSRYVNNHVSRLA